MEDLTCRPLLTFTTKFFRQQENNNKKQIRFELLQFLSIYGPIYCIKSNILCYEVKKMVTVKQISQKEEFITNGKKNVVK
jgi:hypothetical protein